MHIFRQQTKAGPCAEDILSAAQRGRQLDSIVSDFKGVRIFPYRVRTLTDILLLFAAGTTQYIKDAGSTEITAVLYAGRTIHGTGGVFAQNGTGRTGDDWQLSMVWRGRPMKKQKHQHCTKYFK